MQAQERRGGQCSSAACDSHVKEARTPWQRHCVRLRQAARRASGAMVGAFYSPEASNLLHVTGGQCAPRQAFPPRKGRGSAVRLWPSGLAARLSQGGLCSQPIPSA